MLGYNYYLQECACGCGEIITRRRRCIDNRHYARVQLPEHMPKQKRGSESKMWKGDDAKYGIILRWIPAHLPRPETCYQCGIRKPCKIFNISGKYNRDLFNWGWICGRCSLISEGKMDEINRYITDGDFVCKVCGRISQLLADHVILKVFQEE